MTLPGAPFLARDGAELRLDGHALADLARRFGTPLYVYSRRAMLAALDAYQRALRGRPHLVCYAMKANSSLAVLQTFAQAGCGFDIVSGGELARVLAAGGDARRVVVFSGVGKTRAEMRQALQAGVRCFNVESVGETRPPQRGGAGAGPARAGEPARQPGRRRRHAPLHLHRPEGQQVRHRARPGAGRLPPRGVAARAAGGGHRLPHRLADHAAGALPRRARPRARPRRGGGGRRHRDPPRRRRRRPGHHLHRRAAAARRRAGGARCCSAWTRAATATARCCSSPGARWSAMPGCC